MLFLPYARAISALEISQIETYIARALTCGLLLADIIDDVEGRYPAVRLFLTGQRDGVVIAVLEDAPSEPDLVDGSVDAS